uniref:Putative ankyrin repeat protein n=1 Tax=Moumouvirus sp. 'Monve' TaxID=1128131 RepID=H2EFF6_9VIRU|nr:putative ankyrin repeat protein [Moumouvirus Monve]
MDTDPINIFPPEILNIIFEYSENYNLLFTSKDYFCLLNLLSNNDNIIEQAIINGHLYIIFYINHLKRNDNDLIKKINFKSLGLQKYFYLACKFGHLNIVKYFHSQGAKILEDNNEALIEACSYGHKDVVEYLISHGANIYENDNCPIIMASKNGHLDIVILMISINNNSDILSKIFIEAIDHNHLEIIKYLKSIEFDLHIHEDYGFRKSAESNYLDMMKYLISEGANIRACQNYAITKSFQNGHYETVKYLLSLGIDVVKENVGININYALMSAIIKCDVDLVKLLISMSVNIDTEHILTLAQKYNSQKIIDLVKNL